MQEEITTLAQLIKFARSQPKLRIDVDAIKEQIRREFTAEAEESKDAKIIPRPDRTDIAFLFADPFNWQDPSS